MSDYNYTALDPNNGFASSTSSSGTTAYTTGASTASGMSMSWAQTYGASVFGHDDLAYVDINKKQVKKEDMLEKMIDSLYA